MRKHIRTSLTLLIVVLAAASFMLILPGCAGGSNDSPGKPDAVGNRSADGASEATQGDVVSTAMVAYANGDQVLFVDQETQTPYIPTEIDDATIIVDGQQTDEEALVAGNIVQVTGNGIMLESYPGQYPGITKVEVIETGSPADAEQYAEQDEARRDAMLAREEAQRLANEADQALAQKGKQLEKDEKKQIKADVAAVRKLLSKKVNKVDEADVAALRAAAAQLERSSARARDLARQG